MNRSLPLYQGLGFRRQEEGHRPEWIVQNAHPGLVFDKFVDTWATDGDEFREQKPDGSRNASAKVKAGGKRTFFDEIVERGCGSCASLLTRHLDRRALLLVALQGQERVFATDWRFVSGLGSSHPYETGFIWHRTLGVPYLPGSSVKGMMRAWAERWNPESWPSVRRLFGDMEDEGAGSLIVLDALPASAPRLEVDIMNPHYGDYYADSSKPPADYLSPKPVFFLTVVPRTSFRFALAPRDPASESVASDLDKAWEMLADALQWLGAGAKTAVGYGRMLRDRSEEERVSRRVAEERRRAEAERKKQEEKQAAAEKAKALGLCGLALEMAEEAQLQSWADDKGQFVTKAGAWLERIENEDAENLGDAASWLAERMDGLFPGIMSDPDRVRGKKAKPVFKDAQRGLAHRLIDLRNQR